MTPSSMLSDAWLHGISMPGTLILCHAECANRNISTEQLPDKGQVAAQTTYFELPLCVFTAASLHHSSEG